MTFDEFARTDLPGLLRFAKVLCVDRGTAEDVLQEVLLRAHARWSEIGELDLPAAYVRRMIVNEYLSWRRKWSRIIPSASVGADLTAPDIASELADRAALVAEIATLPPRQRAAVVLRNYAGLTDSEIAADLGCSHGTARSHLSRGLATLRVQLRATEDAGEVNERLAN